MLDRKLAEKSISKVKHFVIAFSKNDSDEEQDGGDILEDEDDQE